MSSAPIQFGKGDSIRVEGDSWIAIDRLGSQRLESTTNQTDHRSNPRGTRHMQRLRLTAITVAVGVLSVTHSAFAGDPLDHDEIKQLREAGRILPMGEVMARVQTVQPGQLVEAELELEDGAYLYEIKILAADGTVHKLELDAATGEVLEH